MKTKRTMAGILAVAMTASVMAVTPVFAAGEVGVSVSEAQAKAGESFTLEVSLSGVPAEGLNGCEFSLAYDSTIVTVTDVTAGAVADTGSDAQSSAISAEAPAFECNFATAGLIDVTWSTGLLDNTYWIRNDGVLLTITGTVNESAEVGAVSAFEVQPIARETNQGSGVNNDEILFVNVAEDGTVTTYDTILTPGSVTVIGADVTTTTATTEGTDTETTTTETTTVTTGNGGISDVKYGDVNTDGVVDLLDVIVLNKAMVQLVTLSDSARLNADVDGVVGVSDGDSSVLMDYVAFRITSLPLTAE